MLTALIIVLAFSGILGKLVDEFFSSWKFYAALGFIIYLIF